MKAVLRFNGNDLTRYMVTGSNSVAMEWMCKYAKYIGFGKQ